MRGRTSLRYTGAHRILMISWSQIDFSRHFTPATRNIRIKCRAVQITLTDSRERTFARRILSISIQIFEQLPYHPIQSKRSFTSRLLLCVCNSVYRRSAFSTTFTVTIHTDLYYLQLILIQHCRAFYFVSNSIYAVMSQHCLVIIRILRWSFDDTFIAFVLRLFLSFSNLVSLTLCDSLSFSL